VLSNLGLVAMEVAALRTECSSVLDQLTELERLASRSAASEAQDYAIGSINHHMSHSVGEKLRIAADELRDWAARITEALENEEHEV
jgi:hypothetical protein